MRIFTRTKKTFEVHLLHKPNRKRHCGKHLQNVFIFRQTQVRQTITVSHNLALIFSMNSKYAPYLPADEEGSATTNKYLRMLDKKFSFQPLLRALEVGEKIPGEPSTSGITRKISVSKIIRYFSIDCFKLRHSFTSLCACYGYTGSGCAER